MTRIRTSMDVLGVAPVIPVVIVDDAALAVPLAEALARGGIGIIEITLRTPAALDAIKAVAAEVPSIVTGAGTVTTPALAQDAAEAGATFLVTPGTTETLLDAALATGLPVLPGASSVSEALRLAERGLSALKFFPAEPSGGVGYLAALASPLPGIRWCPTGGVSLSSAPDYLALPNVSCVGGSWLTPKALVAAEDWDGVEALAAQAAALGHD